MIVTQSINVHMDRQTRPTVETVQSDSGRAVAMALFSQGEKWTPPADTTGLIRYSICHEGEYFTSVYDSISDGTSAVTITGNVLQVRLTPEVLSVVGVGELQVELTSANRVIGTLSVLLRVQRNLSLEGQSPTVYNDLTRQIHKEVQLQVQQTYAQGGWMEDLNRQLECGFAAGGLEQGAEVASSSKIRSAFLRHGGRTLTVTFPDGLKVACHFYDEDKNYQYVSQEYTGSFTIYNGCAYVRLVVGYGDSSAVTDVEALGGLVRAFYKSDSCDRFQGHVTALGRSRFFDCHQQGYYRFSAADIPNISDCPDISVGGILEVWDHGGTDVVFQNIHTSDGQIWFRWGNRAFQRLLPRRQALNWYALGDGITQGYFSDAEGLGRDSEKSWVAVAAQENGWILTNHAVGGSGYVQSGTTGDGHNARDHVDTIDFSGAELVTLAFGVNDWKGGCPLGSMEDDVTTGGTVYSNLRYCIEKILADQPCAKVVVISPINCSAYGTRQGNWGMGHAFAGGTLEDFCEAQRTVCAYYGVGFVDLLHQSLVGRQNAPSVLTDGIHPTPACHRLLGIELAARLL